MKQKIKGLWPFFLLAFLLLATFIFFYIFGMKIMLGYSKEFSLDGTISILLFFLLFLFLLPFLIVEFPFVFALVMLTLLYFPTPLGFTGYPEISYHVKDSAVTKTYERNVMYRFDPERNKHLSSVTPEDAERIERTAERFRKSIEAYRRSEDEKKRSLYEHYDFDPACVTPDDYVYFVPKLFYHEFYLYDSGTNTLYHLLTD